MRKKRKNITVAVTPEHYREIRHLAADYDTTVTTLVAYLLKRLPDALRRANYPGPGSKSATAQVTARTSFCACGRANPPFSPINSEPICPKSGQNTESVSQYTVSNHQKTNDFNANSRPCTGSVHAENQPSSDRIAPSAVQTP